MTTFAAWMLSASGFQPPSIDPGSRTVRASRKQPVALPRKNSKRFRGWNRDYLPENAPRLGVALPLTDGFAIRQVEEGHLPQMQMVACSGTGY